MSRNARNQAGFSLVELVVVMTLTITFATTFYVFFRSNLFNYLNLQKQATSLTELSSQSHRIATVVRGATDINSAADNDLSIYAYFYPADAFASLVHYYLNAQGTVLYADVTRMTANPPIGTPITSTKRTYTIIGAFQQVTGNKLFTYKDATGAVLSNPSTSLNSIRQVSISLGVPGGRNGASVTQSLQVDVSLRNRKTNL